MECLVCGNNTKKYKCSKCGQNCCTFECYKIHKNTNCTVIFETEENTGENTKLPAVIGPFQTDDTVDSAKLKELENSTELRNLLCNPHLRDFLLEIDNSNNPWHAMRAAMLEPLFIEFANECLNIVEPSSTEQK